jgi:hypothetical protein
MLPHGSKCQDMLEARETLKICWDSGTPRQQSAWAFRVSAPEGNPSSALPKGVRPCNGLGVSIGSRGSKSLSGGASIRSAFVACNTPPPCHCDTFAMSVARHQNSHGTPLDGTLTPPAFDTPPLPGQRKPLPCAHVSLGMGRPCLAFARSWRARVSVRHGHRWRLEPASKRRADWASRRCPAQRATAIQAGGHRFDPGWLHFKRPASSHLSSCLSACVETNDLSA